MYMIYIYMSYVCRLFRPYIYIYDMIYKWDEPIHFSIGIQMSMMFLGCSGLGHQARWVRPEVSNSLKGGKLWR